MTDDMLISQLHIIYRSSFSLLATGNTTTKTIASLLWRTLFATKSSVRFMICASVYVDYFQDL